MVLEEEISDGELTDLLAEADETASISTRLRPSSLSRPSSSTERRHSQRIQSRARRDPEPRPQTSWVSSTLHRERIICCCFFASRRQVKMCRCYSNKEKQLELNNLIKICQYLFKYDLIPVMDHYR